MAAAYDRDLADTPLLDAESDDPEFVETQLCGLLPDTMWTLASDVQILHGRRICRPKPACNDVNRSVCGCDGKNYKNTCWALRGGTTSAMDGECP